MTSAGDGGATQPHCDGAILHAPGVCYYCDEQPHWQGLRLLWRINFTGEHDPKKAPCPSTWDRSAASRDAWPGNRVRVPNQRTHGGR